METREVASTWAKFNLTLAGAPELLFSVEEEDEEEEDEVEEPEELPVDLEPEVDTPLAVLVLPELDAVVELPPVKVAVALAEPVPKVPIWFNAAEQPLWVVALCKEAEPLKEQAESLWLFSW